MPARKKPEALRKAERMWVRLTKDERKTVEDAAKLNGKTVAEYHRHILLRAAMKNWGY